MIKENYTYKQKIFKENEKSEFIYIITKGSVGIYKKFSIKID